MQSRNPLGKSYLIQNMFNKNLYDFGNTPPPISIDFLLMDNTDFLLMDGSNFLLMGA